MATKLFVGGLPFATTEDELNEIFAAHGTVVSAVIIKDKFSGRSKGFGFVEYESEEEAKAAVEALHDSEIGGRKVTVNEARPPRNDR